MELRKKIRNSVDKDITIFRGVFVSRKWGTEICENVLQHNYEKKDLIFLLQPPDQQSSFFWESLFQDSQDIYEPTKIPDFGVKFWK